MKTNTKRKPAPHAALKIGILKQARRIIADGKIRGLCAATRLATANDDAMSDRFQAGSQLRSYISRALGPYGYLEGWVANEIGMARLDVGVTEEARRKMRATRLAWIDWMIVCYEEGLAMEAK